MLQRWLICGASEQANELDGLGKLLFKPEQSARLGAVNLPAAAGGGEMCGGR